MIGFDWIHEQEYLGRGFLVGQTQQGRDFVAYFITGRSPSSRARKFEFDEENGLVRTVPTDPEVLKQGNSALLIYNALRKFEDFLVVGNGAQTDLVYKELENPHYCDDSSPISDQVKILLWSIATATRPIKINGIDLTSFEPDAPNYTPRITGVVHDNNSAILVCKSNVGQTERSFFESPNVPGFGKFISTYTGQNVPKGQALPSFRGEPLNFILNDNSVEEIARNLYDALGPREGHEDFIVGVVAGYVSGLESKLEPVIINRS